MKLKILGLMSGTSCDGLDASCLEFGGKNWKPIWNLSLTYPRALRQRVLDIQNDAQTSISQILKLNRDLGIWYADSVKDMLSTVAKADHPDVIANHGQTVAHFPKDFCTSQLGDPAILAYESGLTTVTDFRRGDMAAHGQGAPLVPLFHRQLIGPGKSVHNLGGISNFSYVGPKGQVIGYDTGPGNMLIDAAIEKVSRGKLKFDRNGQLAAKGEIDHASLKKLLRHPYFRKAPPKSTGRDDFSLQFLTQNCKAKDESLVTTATALTAVSIAVAYENSILNKGLPLTDIYFCGGGARNRTLLEMIQELLPETTIGTVEDLGLHSQYIEAQAFAFFGFASLKGANLGGAWTGQKPGNWAPPGAITPGKNWLSVAKKVAALK